MKILTYSDNHLREVGSFPPFNKISSNGLTRETNNIVKGLHFVADMIKEHKPDLVINGGDCYHPMDFLSPSIIHASHLGYDPIKNACNDLEIPHVLVPGNHTIYNEAHMITSVSNLTGYFSTITMQDEVIDYDGFKIAYIPYKSSQGEAYQSLVNVDGCVDLIVTHLEFAGSKYENMHPTESNLSPDLVTPCISGHLHLPQKIGNVTYIGSLIQHRFLQYDLKNVGGVMLYDTDTKKIKRIPNTYSKHYVKVTDLKEGLSMDPNHAILKIITKAPKDEIENMFKDYEFIYIKEAEIIDGVSKSYVQFDIDDPLQLLKGYVKSNNNEANDVFDEIFDK